MDERYLGDGMTTQRPIVRFENLTLGYHRHPAVHHLSGEIASGSLLAVVGPNGAGKSTLLKGIVGELTAMQGSIALSGVERRSIAYLAQQSSVDSSFPVTVRDFVAMGLWAEFGAFRRFDTKAKQRIDQAISAVGLSGRERSLIGQLSGGQLQRARFARLMLQDAALVLLDEPYSAIDANTVRDLATLVRQWNTEGRTVVSVLHDFEHVREEYPEVMILAREMIARGETRSTLTAANLAEAQRRSEVGSHVDDATVCHHTNPGEHESGGR
ncbi:metal ABC transporter ATP-binding protein [Propionivibrio dicarboxylicus]|uniref:Zinc/manganese transport system ATP-binding protein n=1 Tax=Propionivibrio dicarboxylicus TaxID=83767 RepID=A0A1G8CZH6_9RHOO|nr:ABC transporter ATP-binding protein [Propionivibrio dicarboxylicus]SDH50916.1 zinc/manganese transport system ATP-binding protein [Propionivibrio dicarboxylicus]